MNRGWFTIIGGMVILSSFLLPTVPLPPEWHAFADKFPAALNALSVYLGWQAYDKNPDGSKALGTGDGIKGGAAPSVVVVTPPVKPEEPLIKP